ncbi:MSP-domain protein 4 [Aphelenchoides avenae]|nr:MSP-domain protein 4 [Aphelenchus avenae]
MLDHPLGLLFVPLTMILLVVVGCGKQRPPPTSGARKKSIKDKPLSKSSKSAKSERSLKSSKSKRVKPVVAPIQRAAPVKPAVAPLKKDASLRAPPSLLREEPTQASIAELADGNLEMEPRKLEWENNGGVQNVVLRNNTGERRAIKIKCSDTQRYRVNPVYAFVESGETLKVDISRQPGKSKADQLIFVTTKAKADDKEAKKLFQAGAQNNMQVLPLVNTAAA